MDENNNHRNVERVPGLVGRLYKIVSELEALFPGRYFTPDGHLVNLERLIHVQLEEWDMSAEEVAAATKNLINQELFTSGHKSPKLQGAYEAARSARFEFGEIPRSPH